MKFYVRYQTYRYEGYSDEVFDTIEDVVKFLNQHASNPDFDFMVIEGRLVYFEPVEVVKAYRRKE